MNKKIWLSLVLAASIFCTVILLDMLTKHYICASLGEAGNAKEVVPGFFNFMFVKNTGAAWGIFAGNQIFLIIISVLVLCLYLTFFILKLREKRQNTSIILGISVGLIVGGCIGNLIDRIFLGYVRDFINLQFMKFPVFNFADISLTIGVILVIIYFIFISPKENKKELSAPKDESSSCGGDKNEG